MPLDGLYVLLAWFDALRESDMPVTRQDKAMQMLLADLLADYQDAVRNQKRAVKE